MRRLLGLILVLTLFSLACESETTKQNRRAQHQREAQVEKATRDRTFTFEQAQRVHTVPKLENFPLRAALVEFTKRQDMLNHPWYVYILGENGNMIGYYTARTYPQNACNFLSSTAGGLPSLDGVFYGGSGASGACTAVFFFDNATNAMVVVDRLATFATDVPLDVNAQPIKVKSGN